MSWKLPRLLTFLLLSITIGGGSVLPSLLPVEEEHPFSFLMEEKADSDDSEESSETELLAILPPGIDLSDHTWFEEAPEDADHQSDWLVAEEHAARAPPQG